MRAIPKGLLTHSASLLQASKDAYQNPTYTPLAQLSRVLVQPCRSMTVGKDDVTTQLDLKLIFDCKSSLPIGTTFALGQCIAYGSSIYEIVRVDEYRYRNRLHHVEVGLRG